MMAPIDVLTVNSADSHNLSLNTLAGVMNTIFNILRI